MKVYLLKNAEGNVICTFEKADSGQDPMTPIIPDGHKVEEVDAPDDYTKDLRAFYNKHSTK